jgi:hypothetical protein
VSEQSGQRGAVSRQLSSLWLSIYEGPLTGTEYSAPLPRHRQTSEIQEPDTITNASPLSPQPETSEGRSLGQIMVILVVLLVLVNIPISHYGAGLAQIIPDATAIVIDDGLILKGSGPKIYVLENYKLRWISSPEAFNYYFRQHNVQIVEDSLLEQLGKGQPIHRLVKCQGSPYVYALENGLKRWVKDPPAQNKSKPWDAVRLVSCDHLRNLPDGLPIPEDAGSPP